MHQMLDAVGHPLDEVTQRHRLQIEPIEDRPAWESPAKFQIGGTVADTVDNIGLMEGQGA